LSFEVLLVDCFIFSFFFLLSCCSRCGVLLCTFFGLPVVSGVCVRLCVCVCVFSFFIVSRSLGLSLGRLVISSLLVFFAQECV